MLAKRAARFQSEAATRTWRPRRRRPKSLADGDLILLGRETLSAAEAKLVALVEILTLFEYLLVPRFGGAVVPLEAEVGDRVVWKPLVDPALVLREKRP